MVNADSWWDGLVRDRFQAVLELVLDAISEDYVTVEIILKTINEWDGERDPASWARGVRLRFRARRSSRPCGS